MSKPVCVSCKRETEIGYSYPDPERRGSYVYCAGCFPGPKDESGMPSPSGASGSSSGSSGKSSSEPGSSSSEESTSS